MVSSPKNEISIGTYVQLKEGFDETDFYRNVEAGATGWVKQVKIDDGFPMIFIEWDENHPNYAGEKNKWVYESHFEVISDPNTVIESYIAAIRKATDQALGAEAFIMISISRVKHPITGKVFFKPSFVSHDLNDDAACVLEAQIAFAATQLYNDYIENILDSLREDENESGR